MKNCHQISSFGSIFDVYPMLTSILSAEIEDVEELCEIIECDDKERFVALISDYNGEDDSLCMNVLSVCAKYRAKKCVLAMLNGEGCISAQELYTKLLPRYSETQTPLACVAYYFHEAYDIIHDILLKQGPVEHANIECCVIPCFIEPVRHTPLGHLLFSLGSTPHLEQWASGTSLIKLIILLCQWETKSSLDSARLLASYTDGLNDIAWRCVKEGRLISLAALLLVAQEKVLVPFDSGLTIRERIIKIVDALSAEGDLDHDATRYQFMLIEACKLLDIFEKVGGCLHSYCSSMHEYVPPHKVLMDVASLFKKCGYALQPMDFDLRDCYRQCPEVNKASFFKMADTKSSNNKYQLPSSLPGDCQLFQKLKAGRMLNLMPSASMPRLLRTAAVEVENAGSHFTRKHLAYLALHLKRGIKF